MTNDKLRHADGTGGGGDDDDDDDADTFDIFAYKILIYRWGRARAERGLLRDVRN